MAAHASQPAEEDYGAQLRTLYASKNPSKVGEIPRLLEKYKGKEEALLASVRKKYGVKEGEALPAASREKLRATEAGFTPGVPDHPKT